MGYSDAYPGGYGAGGDLVTTLLIETTAGVWYDATDDLISGSIIRGRQSELDEFQAGTCDVLLDNDDRKYDPTYASSPLNGHILPMKRVKILATWAGTQYPLFAGYADRWTQNRDGPHRGTTTLAATDGFKVLARANLAGSSYKQEVTADGPVAWWRMDEAGGTVVHDSVGIWDLTANDTPTLGEPGLIARDPGSAGATDTNTDGWSRRGPLPVGGAPLSLEAVIQTTAGAAVLGMERALDFASDEAVLDSDQFRVRREGVGTATVAPTVTTTDGDIHHLVGVWEADGDIRIYVDGVDVTDSVDNVTAGAFGDDASGITYIAGSEADTGIAPGVVDELAVYDYALTAARIAAHAAAVTTPWDGDLPGERIERVLDAIGWPDALRDIDTGVTVLQPAELDMTALEHIQKVALTELGVVYMTADGILRFEARSETVNQPVVAEFSDAAGTDLPITYSAPELTDEDIRNDITVSRLDGVAQTARDATSIAAYQVSSYTVEGLYHDDDEHSRYLAQFLLDAYKDPVERVRSMTVNPYRDPDDLWPAILGLELTDRVTLEETPQHVTPAVTRTLVVEGISHTFGPKSWETALDVSENTAATQAYWALGVAGASELGQTTRLWI